MDYFGDIFYYRNNCIIKCMKNKEEYKSVVETFGIGMTKKEIRTLCWWACVGIARSKGGTYEKIAPKMIKYFAEKLKFRLPYKPEFNTKIKQYKRTLP